MILLAYVWSKAALDWRHELALAVRVRRRDAGGELRRRDGLEERRLADPLEQRRPHRGRQCGGGATAIPRTVGGEGTGDSFQMTASSPSTTCEARTGSASRSGRSNSACVSGSGRTIVMPPTGVSTGAVGAGARNPCVAVRSKVPASPSTTWVPAPASHASASSESCPPDGFATVETGRGAEALDDRGAGNALGVERCRQAAAQHGGKEWIRVRVGDGFDGARGRDDARQRSQERVCLSRRPLASCDLGSVGRPVPVGEVARLRDDASGRSPDRAGRADAGPRSHRPRPRAARGGRHLARARSGTRHRPVRRRLRTRWATGAGPTLRTASAPPAAAPDRSPV